MGRLASGRMRQIWTGFLSLMQHEEIGTESRSGAKLDLAFEYSLVIDFNIRHQLILLEHFEGRLPRTQVGHKEKRSPTKLRRSLRKYTSVNSYS